MFLPQAKVPPSCLEAVSHVTWPSVASVGQASRDSRSSNCLAKVPTRSNGPTGKAACNKRSRSSKNAPTGPAEGATRPGSWKRAHNGPAPNWAGATYPGVRPDFAFGGPCLELSATRPIPVEPVGAVLGWTGLSLPRRSTRNFTEKQAEQT